MQASPWSSPASAALGTKSRLVASEGTSRDGAEVGIREGITSIVQPGGALRDWDVIDCANDAGVAMVFTGQRSFRH